MGYLEWLQGHNHGFEAPTRQLCRLAVERKEATGSYSIYPAPPAAPSNEWDFQDVNNYSGDNCFLHFFEVVPSVDKLSGFRDRTTTST